MVLNDWVVLTYLSCRLLDPVMGTKNSIGMIKRRMSALYLHMEDVRAMATSKYFLETVIVISCD